MRATCSVHMPLRFIIFSVHSPRIQKSGITAITFCSKLFLILCCILYGWNSLPRFEVLTSYIKHVLKTLRMFQCFPYKFHCESYVYWTVHHLDSWIKIDQLVTFLLFHYLMLNVFRILVHPSSGACYLFVLLFHGLYCSGSMCVCVTLWFGWCGVVSGCRLQPA